MLWRQLPGGNGKCLQKSLTSASVLVETATMRLPSSSLERYRHAKPHAFTNIYFILGPRALCRPRSFVPASGWTSQQQPNHMRQYITDRELRERTQTKYKKKKVRMSHSSNSVPPKVRGGYIYFFIYRDLHSRPVSHLNPPPP